MALLSFSLFMLTLALIAQFRTVHVSALRPFWFFGSLLPSELPWLFGIVQLISIPAFLFAQSSVTLLDAVAVVLSVATVGGWYLLHQKTFAAGPALRAAVEEGLATPYDSIPTDYAGVSAPAVIDQKAWLRPFHFRRPGVERLADIRYGEHPRQQLDIYRPTIDRPPAADEAPRPVLLHIHGGAWVLGNKRQQGQALMHHLAQNGWICVDINYRLAPRHRYPACLIDVKTAIAWIKSHIAEYGGDPEFIALTGGSAGGHLAMLSALTPNKPMFQPGFEQADTQVQAVVPMYGVYDFTNTNRSWSGKKMAGLLQRFVMPAPQNTDPELWQLASPRFQISSKAPPMFIIHGTTDCLVFIEEARDFVGVLREKSQAPVLYAELDGAQHGFDLFHAVRTELAIEAVGKFLLHCYQRHKNSPSSP